MKNNELDDFIVTLLDDNGNEIDYVLWTAQNILLICQLKGDV